jgi:RimJ/RimL family protein N-acetyltransferase
VTRIEPWGPGDLALLERLNGDPALMAHVGGAETPEKIAERQSRYSRPGSRQFKILEPGTGQGVGWVGYWEREWGGEEVYEAGWSLLAAFHGRGMAAEAAAHMLAAARAEQDRRFMHAFPAPENGPSNAICRKVGFTLMGECDFEYPKGVFVRSNDWRYDLFSGPGCCPTPER